MKGTGNPYMTLIERIQRNEGCPKHINGNARIYQDDKGNITGGYGWNFTAHGIPMDVVNQLFMRSLCAAEVEAEGVIGHQAWLKMNEHRRGVVTELVFWMGAPTFREFRKTIQAIRKNRWGTAAAEMLNSTAGREYRTRMSTLADIMRSGEVEAS